MEARSPQICGAAVTGVEVAPGCGTEMHIPPAIGPTEEVPEGAAAFRVVQLKRSMTSGAGFFFVADSDARGELDRLRHEGCRRRLFAIALHRLCAD